MEVTRLGFFKKGDYYPPIEQEDRIFRYQKNKPIVKGDHYKIFNQYKDKLNDRQEHVVYISTNLPNLICKKSADFLFGETPTYSAGKSENSEEQKAIERFVKENDLNIVNYESALGNAYRGDSFYKIRWGQLYNGLLDKKLDPFRVIIQPQMAEYVFVETTPGDSKTAFAYHIAYPMPVDGTGDEEWVLNVESHYPGKILYTQFRMSPRETSNFGYEVVSWTINDEIPGAQKEVETGIPFPLIVHVPNYASDDEFFGMDDLTESMSLFDEINNRLSKIAEILDKHSDPAMSVPSNSLEVDEQGNPVFHVGREKIFETDKGDPVPQYITWNGQLDAAFKELEALLDQVMLVSEIPAVALGKTDSGTSGSSGLSIKWRMNSLLAKINRKRQYYDKGLKRVLLIAQLLEHAKLGEEAGYEVTIPNINFKDGLPDDAMEQATIAQIKTGGKATQSQLSAIMSLHGYTEEQAQIELKRIRDEEKAESFVESNVFNQTDGSDD